MTVRTAIARGCTVLSVLRVISVAGTLLRRSFSILSLSPYGRAVVRADAVATSTLPISIGGDECGRRGLSCRCFGRTEPARAPMGPGAAWRRRVCGAGQAAAEAPTSTEPNGGFRQRLGGGEGRDSRSRGLGLRPSRPRRCGQRRRRRRAPLRRWRRLRSAISRAARFVVNVASIAPVLAVRTSAA